MNFSDFNLQNLEYIRELYLKYLNGEISVDSNWADFFAEFDLGEQYLEEAKGPSWKQGEQISNLVPQGSYNLAKHYMVAAELIKAYQDFGHKTIDYDPLDYHKPSYIKAIDLSSYNLTEKEMDLRFPFDFMGLKFISLKTLITFLQKRYTNKIGYEYNHIENYEEKAWIENNIAKMQNYNLNVLEKELVFQDILKSESFEKFLNTKFLGTKRFGADGLDTFMVILEEITREGAKKGINDVTLGMAHRGRLNTLCNYATKRFSTIVAEFQDKIITKNEKYTSDVKYHKGYKSKRHIAGKNVAIRVMANPSHLEAVNPIVLGNVRAKQDKLHNKNKKNVLGVLIHGDSSVTSLGFVQESFSLHNLKGYSTLGTVHIILNNMLGFTAMAGQDYSQDQGAWARFMGVPCLHVSASSFEELVKVARFAINYRQTFGKDIFINLVGYRKMGHNEGIEPRFTQGLLYKNVTKDISYLAEYKNKLLQEGTFSTEELNKKIEIFNTHLQQEYELALSMVQIEETPEENKEKAVKAIQSKTTFFNLALNLLNIPSGFNTYHKLQRIIDEKQENLKTKGLIDIPLAETLAFATILQDGKDIRITGEDVEIGTFYSRHSFFLDMENNTKYIPLNNIPNKEGTFSIYNSTISEFGVLGYEYGYSLENSKGLTIWEAQYGDFVNAGQVIIDQYLSSSFVKWGVNSSLILLLPHGLEGQGAEHSSARVERFLNLYVDKNMSICFPTTAANYFHLLRRQLGSSKPLIIFSTKSGLRDKFTFSKIDDFVKTGFKKVLTSENLKNPTRILIVCGKIYLDICKYLEDKQIKNIKVIRLEEVAPFPKEELKTIISKHQGIETIYLQEEPLNMGAFAFVFPYLSTMVAEIKFVGRRPSPSPATGFYKKHIEEQNKLLDIAITASFNTINNRQEI